MPEESGEAGTELVYNMRMVELVVLNTSELEGLESEWSGKGVVEFRFQRLYGFCWQSELGKGRLG